MNPSDPSPLGAEHPGLLSAAAAGIEAVARMPATLSGSGWMPDWEYGQRARHLAAHLRQIVTLASVPAYPSALALSRTALEHHLLDELLLHGTMYRQTMTGVDDALFAEYEADLDAGTEPWTKGVESIERRKGDRAVIIRTGMPVVDDDGTVTHHLSPYYLFTQEHQPLVGRPADQADDGVLDRERRRDHARRNEDLYRSYLSWSAMRDNLVLNALHTEPEVRRVDVHYRFLSMYVHATNAGYDHFRDGAIAGHDHYFGELALLYVAWIAASELEIFARYLKGRDLDGGGALQDLACDLASETAHFWPPKGTPHAYDRWNEANRRRFIQHRTGRQDDPAVLPSELLDDDISYYTDPLRRLRSLHSSTREMVTGFVYASPWPRNDGRRR